MELSVSTLALAGTPIEQIIQLAQTRHWSLEFSSGLPYRVDMEAIFLQAPLKKFAHNYFPAPENPFVLNLASSNQKIRERSVQHCIESLYLSHKAGCPFFSAHAGFCLDPQPGELGKKLSLTQTFDRNKHWQLFMTSLKLICKEASAFSMKFLVENNVLAPINVYPDGSNPLLCCDANELVKMLNEVSSPALGLLIDTGHLKVSAQTLGFDKDEAMNKLKNSVHCLHHSDNNGAFDTNDKISTHYWFFKHLPAFQNCVHVLEVKKLSEVEIEEQLLILRAHGK